MNTQRTDPRRRRRYGVTRNPAQPSRNSLRDRLNTAAGRIQSCRAVR